MRLLRPAHSVIGLDLGSRKVKAAQLHRRRGSWRLSAVAEIPRQESQSLIETAARIAGVLERHGFSGTRVAIAAPLRKVESGILDVPPRGSGAPIEQIAAAELGRTAKLKPGEFEASFWDVPAPARGSGGAVLGVALRHEDADQLADPLEAAGFEVRAIDVEGWAIQRACCSRLAAEQASAILDLGWSAASLYIADRQSVLYQRALWDSGIQHLVQAMVAEHNMPEEAAELLLHGHPAGHSAPAAQLPRLIRHFVEQLCDELRLSLAFVRQRFPGLCGDSLLVTGGGADLPGMASLLTARLQGSISLLRAQDVVGLERGMESHGGSALLTTALGLALYQEGP
jgi:type IV pilus assembly protein PilM